MSVLGASRRLEKQVNDRESAKKAQRAAVAKVYRCRHAAQILGALAAKLAASLTAETQALVEERERLAQRESRVQGLRVAVVRIYAEATQERQAVKEALRQAKIARMRYDVADRRCVVKTKPGYGRRR